MLNCQNCRTNQTTSYLTRCCKTFICLPCKQSIDKKSICHCGKNSLINKKSYNDSPQIFQLLKMFYEARPQECHRCDMVACYQCQDCSKLFCEDCDTQIHDSPGFSKHQRSKYSLQTNLKIEDKVKKRDFICKNHSQKIINVCQCGTRLCTVCIKSHKDTCSKGGKLKSLKVFKEQYFENVDFLMRQLSNFKQNLKEDQLKYLQHFKNQKVSFTNFIKSTDDKLQHILKVLEMKIKDIQIKINNFWQNCETVYNKNQQSMKFKILKYDQYGELLQRFARYGVSVEYLEKRISRFYPYFDFCNLKSLSTEQLQINIANLQLNFVNWEISKFSANHPEEANNTNIKEQHKLLFKNHQNDSQLLFLCTLNPLKSRKLHLISSHSQIFYSYLHLPFQNLQYDIQYGVGIKMKGQQIFKKVLSKNGFGIIQGLNASTKYRIRMKVQGGQWSEILQIATSEAPIFDTKNSQSTKSISLDSNNNSFQFLKAGIIYGSNDICFGIHRWVIKILVKSNSLYEESETDCISVGVSSKQGKKVIFVGSTFNYGYQKDDIVLKISLNCNQKKLVIQGPNKQEIFQNLPAFPIFPTIQNKGNSQVLIKYSLINDDQSEL